MYWGMEVQLHAFLISAVQQSPLIPQKLYLQGKSPLYHWTGGWVGPKASLDMVVKRKNPIIAPSRK
jgi:hypothetical protein